jgi:thiosulfate/3-mercaptopyruvate sulfurtransferase
VNLDALVPAEQGSALLGHVTWLDVRWKLGRDDGYEQFLAGHVPGAAYVDLENDLADPPRTGRTTTGGASAARHPLPDPDRFAAVMRRCGVGTDRPVVVYDDVSGTSATRAWWLLRHHGHPDVRVLDGGWSSWVGAGGPVEQGVTSPEPGDFTAEPGVLPVLDAAAAARVAGEGVLLDARSPERYRGEVEPVDPVAGHIPGAVNVPSGRNLTGVGPGARFRTVEELRQLYRQAGVGADTEVGVYCGSGVTATHDVFALHLLGEAAALYPGSWSEWVGDESRPVETGGTR